MNKLSGLLILAAAGGLALGVPSSHAAGVLIPAVNRVDATHDDQRNIVYITNGDSILRYDPVSGAFLTPIVLEPGLRGLDLSPDGNTLAVACSGTSATSNWIYLVNPEDGSSRKIEFTRASGESGTFTVKWLADGGLYVSSSYNGSGTVPLRRYDPATGSITVVQSRVEQNTMLAASGDGLTLATAGSNSSAGPFGTFDLALNTWKTTGRTNWYNFEVGISANGGQLAIPTYAGTFVYDRSFTKVATLGAYAGQTPIGAAYHPVENLLYLPVANTAEVRVFDTTAFSQIGSINVGSTFSWVGNRAFVSGRTRLALDGSRLLVTVDGGVQYVPLYAPLQAADSAAETLEDQAVPVPLAATIGNSGILHFDIGAGPAHGVLSGSAPDLTYTPAANFNGADSFTFRARYGAAERTGTVQINVQAQNDAPTAQPIVAETAEDNAITLSPEIDDVDLEDANPDVLSLTAQVVPTAGTVAVTDGKLVYTPAPNFNGNAVIQYTATDRSGATANSTATVSVLPVNDAPRAAPDSFTVRRGSTTYLAVKTNDSDVDGDALTVVSVSQPARGSAILSNGFVFYRANSTFTGTTSFSYTVTDGHGATSTATVTMRIVR